MPVNRRPLTIALHWATALLIMASFTIAWLRTDIEDLDRRLFWLDLHRCIGLLVFSITLLRLLQRFAAGTGFSAQELGPGLWLASRLTHALLYAGLITMPLLGWAQSSAKARHHLSIFGIHLPSIVRHDAELADSLSWWHEQVGWGLLVLIALHASAALWHHYIRRDQTLQSMLPRLRKTPLIAERLQRPR